MLVAGCVPTAEAPAGDLYARYERAVFATVTCMRERGLDAEATLGRDGFSYGIGVSSQGDSGGEHPLPSIEAAMEECEEATGLKEVSMELSRATDPTEAEYREIVVGCAEEVGVAIDPKATTDELYAAAYRGGEPGYIECIYARFGDIARRNLQGR